MSHLVTDKLGLGGTWSYNSFLSTLFSFQKKISYLSVKIPITVDPGQTPTEVYTFQDESVIAKVPTIHLAFQDNHAKTKIFISQCYSDC